MTVREVVLDTETTGIEPQSGHRIVEIGCVELINHVASGEVFHVYVNPERPMPSEAFIVHGLSAEFLADKPVFADVAEAFLAFVGDAPLIIHNATFDMAFINAELTRIGRAPIAFERAIDTLAKARRMFPGSPASLDALCRRYEVDLSERAFHGALKDSQLLAVVYLELIGGRQPGLGLVAARRTTAANAAAIIRAPILIQPTPSEAAAHAAFLSRLNQPLWTQLRG